MNLRSVHLRNFNSYSSQYKEIDSKLSPLKTLQLNGCHNCDDVHVKSKIPVKTEKTATKNSKENRKISA